MATTASLTRREQRLLAVLGEQHYATVEQFRRRLYSPTATSKVWETTKALVEKGYLHYDFLRRPIDVGRSPRIYAYTEPGRAYLLAQGFATLPRRTHRPAHHELFQQHVLGLGDIIVAFRAYEARHPDRMQIERIDHDLILKRTPVQASLDGKTVRYIPDLWMEIRVDGRKQPLAIEYDRGSEDEEQWRQKVAAMTTVAQGAMQERFGVKGFRFVVIVNPEPAHLAVSRMERLIRWTENELTVRKRNGSGWGALFRIAAVNPATCDVEHLFTAPWWVSPFDPQPRPLVVVA